MRNGPGLMIIVAAAVASAACAGDEGDQNIAITNNTAGADIEALPADESSATSSGELANGAADDASAADNATANNSL